ncbi:MAG TPA: hypothetical protein VHY55_06415 [Acidimicrobiia bacterium]|jgi:hypothetical protein|nr:hypothetical protein [Acidimicrobiia bacterium]
MQKPHRVLIETVTGYADDAAAYLRRRRLTRDPYARVWWPGDRGAAFDASTDEGRALFLAASRLIDVGGEVE